MLFHVLFQSQVGIATGFMEETWSRNLLNLLTTPLTEAEYAAGLGIYSIAKSALAMLSVSFVAFVFYGFGLGEVGWGLVPIVFVLLAVGLAVALVNIGLMLRFGQSAEIFTWGMNFLILAVSGVFNPVEALPDILQPIARLLPTTYVFSAARTVLDGQPVPWDQLAKGFVGAVALVALAYLFVVRMLATFRRQGFVTRYS
jgi:ABC-2 type transport system permease protein